MSVIKVSFIGKHYDLKKWDITETCNVGAYEYEIKKGEVWIRFKFENANERILFDSGINMCRARVVESNRNKFYDLFFVEK